MDDYTAFINLDVSGYIGEWVAIVEGKIVSHGKNVKLVLEEANKKSNKRPLIAKIPQEEAMIF